MCVADQRLPRLLAKPAYLYPCEACGRSYCSRDNLLRHKRVECGKQPSFACAQCPRRFHYKNKLNKHVSKVHDKQPLWQGFSALWILSEGPREIKKLENEKHQNKLKSKELSKSKKHGLIKLGVNKTNLKINKSKGIK